MTTEEMLEMTWATHEAFRRFGVPSEDIVLACECGPESDQVFLRVTQGEKSFDFVVGKRAISVDEFQTAWIDFATRVNERRLSDAELDRMYETWLGQVDVTGLASAMMRKGIRIGSLVGIQKRT